MDMIAMLLGLIAIAACAGILAGLFGVGGGLILVPAFYYLFQAIGFPHPELIQISIATSLTTIIVTSLRSTMAHHQKGAVDWDILKKWAPAVAIGSTGAVFWVQSIKPMSLMLIFGALAFIIALVMFFGVGKVQIADEMPKGPKVWVMGVLTGFLSTMMGIGGGSIAVPIMVMHGRPMHRAVATASGFGGAIAIPSALFFMLSRTSPENIPPLTIGYVNLPAAFIVILVTYFTTPFGVKLAHRLDAIKLKRYFSIFIAIVALNMIRKALS